MSCAPAALNDPAGLSVKLRRTFLCPAVILAALAAAPVTRADGDAAAVSPVALMTLPMSFEANAGQWDSQVKYVARGHKFSVSLLPTQAVLLLGEREKVESSKTRPAEERTLAWRRAHGAGKSRAPVSFSTLSLSLVGANQDARVEGEGEMPGTINYFLGDDPAQWRTGISSFSRVKYSGVYPGVDLVYYGNQRQLEYDFIVSPGANPGVIAIEFASADKVEVDSQGELVVHLGGGHLRWHKPVAYQTAADGRHEIAAAYSLHGARQVRFTLGQYDPLSPLVIDPILVYSTYLGGNDFDTAEAITVDSAGSVYVTGETPSTNFPTASGYTNRLKGANDVFITKLNSNGTALVYSTYLGGSSNDFGRAIAIDSNKNVYVTGYSDSANFPQKNGLPSNQGGGADTTFGNAFLTKIGPFGTNLLFSTYFGGNYYDNGTGIAVDNNGIAYVVGQSYSDTSFPKKSPFQNNPGGDGEAFVAKFDTTTFSVVYASLLGGSADEGAGEVVVALDGAGNAYVAGQTTSVAVYPDPPTSNFASAVNPQSYGFQPTYGGSEADGWLVKINAAGSAVVFATFVGGDGLDNVTGIALDTSTNIYLTGQSDSDDLPVVNAHQSVIGGGGDFFTSDAFVIKLNSTATSVLYSTYFGGTLSEGGLGIAVDSSRNAYIVGFTDSDDLTVTPGAPQTEWAGFNDLFVAKFSTTATGTNSLVFSTYLGGDDSELSGFTAGIAVDTNASFYVTSDSFSTNFPTAGAGVYRTNNAGSADAIVAKFVSPVDLSLAMVVSTNILNLGSNLLYTLTAYNTSLTNFSTVTVTDQLPAGLQFISATNLVGTKTNSGNLVTFTFPSMTNGAVRTATILAKTISAGTLINQATLIPAGGEPNTNNNVAIATSAVRGFADLKMNVTVAPSPVDNSSNVTYSITITNLGPHAANSIVFTDALPAEIQFISAVPSQCSGAVGIDTNNVLTWTLCTSLASNATASITIVGTVMTSNATVTNVANISAFDFDNNLADNTVTSTTTVRQLVDLAISPMTDAPDPAIVTSNLTYTVSVTNRGPGVANAAVLTDPLPVNSTFVSATTSRGSFSQTNNIVTFNLGTMASNDVATVTVAAKPTTLVPLTNVVTASTASFDLVSSNNAASATTTVRGIADLVLGVADTPDPVINTSNLTYTIAMTNLGTYPATSVVVTSALPAGLQFISATPSQGTAINVGKTVTWTLPSSLANNATASLTIVGNVATNATSITTAVGATAYEFDPNSANNLTNVATTVAALADLTLSPITDAPDPVSITSNVTYTVTVTNRGPGTAAAVVLTDTLPATATYVSASTTSGSFSQTNGIVTFNLGSINSSATATVTVVARANVLGSMTNSASLSSGSFDYISSNNGATVVTTVNPLADLLITKTALSNSVVRNDNVTYTIIVTNRGPTGSTNITMTDPLPANTTYVSSTPSQGFSFLNGNTVNWAVGNLALGAAATNTVVLRTLLDGALVNIASVSSATTDPTSGNNSASSSVTVTPLADLRLTSMTASPDPVNVSNNTTFTISVLNFGPSSAGSVTLSDVVPTGMSYVSSTTSRGSISQSGGVVTGNLGTMTNGATATVTITVKVTKVGVLTNTASVTTSATDPVSANNVVAGTVAVAGISDLSIIKTSLVSTVIVSSNLTYTISITNRGPQDAVGVYVADEMPPDTVLAGVDASQGSFRFQSNTAVFLLGTVTNGGAATMTLTVRPWSAGPITNVAFVSAPGTDTNTTNNTSAEVVVTVLNHPTLPFLKVLQSGTNIVLYWPSNYTGFTLQLNTDYSTTNVANKHGWITETNLPVLLGGQYYITNSMQAATNRFADYQIGPGAAVFYRLRK